MNLRLINQIRLLLLPSTAFGESLHVGGCRRIRTFYPYIKSVVFYQMSYAPVNSNLTYLNLACTSLHFVNNNSMNYRGFSITSNYSSNSRDNYCLHKVREYLRIVPKPRLSTPTPTRFAF